jgi:hypothetical protein
VTAVIARHFATRDGTMRASHAVLAFGLLVASAATVTANHNSDANGAQIAHTYTNNELNGAPLSKSEVFRRHPNSRRSFKRARTTTRSDALRVSPRGVRVLPVLALGAGLLERRHVTAARAP